MFVRSAGNIIQATGEAVISCCGISLPPVQAEEQDDDHVVHVEQIEDEHYVADHPMTKNIFFRFLQLYQIRGV